MTDINLEGKKLKQYLNIIKNYLDLTKLIISEIKYFLFRFKSRYFDKVLPLFFFDWYEIGCFIEIGCCIKFSRR